MLILRTWPPAAHTLPSGPDDQGVTAAEYASGLQKAITCQAVNLPGDLAGRATDKLAEGNQEVILPEGYAAATKEDAYPLAKC